MLYIILFILESFGVKVLSKTMKEVANAYQLINITEYISSPSSSSSLTAADTSSSSSSSSSTEDTIPLYTFIVPMNDWGDRMLRDVPTPEPLLKKTKTKTKTGEVEEITPAYSIQLQFYLGAAGTGAPIHYHGPAINTLAYGEKVATLYIYIISYILCIIFSELYTIFYFML
jgi:hypothetical protein